MTSGLESERPVADAARYDKIGVLPLFVSITQGVFADPFADMVDRDELTAVRMPAQHKIRARRRFGIEIIRLVITG